MADNRKILVVIVLYKTTLKSTQAYQSWKATKACWRECVPQLLLYNNGPEAIAAEDAQEQVVNASHNSQLSGAYNTAWKLAKQEDASWLILLDQDTEINEAYISEVEQAIKQLEENKMIAAIIPRFFRENNQHVPFTYNPLLFPEWTQKQIPPYSITTKCVFAFNSGIVLSRDAIDSIQGFSDQYPLDYQDANYLLRLHQKGYHAYVLNASLKHDLSVWNYAKNMSAERYQSIMKAQKQFAKDCGWLCIISLRIYMIGRIAKWIFHADKRPYIPQTCKNLF